MNTGLPWRTTNRAAPVNLIYPTEIWKDVGGAPSNI